MSDEDRSMKPLLGKLIEEAVHLALIDCCIAIGTERGLPEPPWTIDQHREVNERLKAAWHHDIYAIPSEVIAEMDPVAFAQCLSVRLLGSGGWMVEGVYAGNASARDLFDATFERPDRSHVSEVAFDVLKAMDDAGSLGPGTVADA